MALIRPQSGLGAYAGMAAYAGDLHNHCAISYGHGTLADAYRNARLQLDFATVTGHAAWHDMPSEPAHVSDYHSAGFARLRGHWPEVQRLTEEVNVDGSFVSLLSFEWHSMTYGDHCVYYKSGTGPLEPAQAQSLEELREVLRGLGKAGLEAFVIPHHIGYRADRRGINWNTYDPELSPVVELVSMHGCGESADAPRNYLHTMGPRDAGSMADRGLELGNTFGFIGSTDHHSAHPGSHGHGRAMVWAEELTRDGIWDAIKNRRTYAATGDRIMLATSIDGHPMGAEYTNPGMREITVEVLGGDTVDYVEIMRNNEVIAKSGPTAVDAFEFDGMLAVSVGWGEVGVLNRWNVQIEIRGGRIQGVEPRFHGYDIVEPSAAEPDSFSFSHWDQQDAQHLSFTTETHGNPNVLTDATQQMALHVTGNKNTVLSVTFNGKQVHRTIGELLRGPQSEYLGGFLTGAMLLHRAVPHTARHLTIEHTDTGTQAPRDQYYARVRQHNDHYAWSSPTFINN
ncbi:hypothetical protein ART_0858 [Arthrobacter sp. PAMC 25486]|uniref:DUF3604 domain-containing protein n=1 Tax=Arthrobacter sp. PAMC 25486 TaxID=1494608 RepID=UPI000535A114|nr:DUF3604 domain-containing protein [Arthrobacter sp. PAMC 25486]AIY00457.1 hypothetical protein ART_0858 [Arthrobacter sp. PAMC 25486]